MEAIIDLIKKPGIWEIVFSTLVCFIYVFTLFNNFMSRIEPRHKCVRELSHKIIKRLANFWEISFFVGALAEEESSERAFLNLQVHKDVQDRLEKSSQLLDMFVNICKLVILLFSSISLVAVILMIFSSSIFEFLYRKIIWYFFAGAALFFSLATFILEKYFIRKEDDAKKWDDDLKRLYDSTISDFPFLMKVRMVTKK